MGGVGGWGLIRGEQLDLAAGMDRGIQMDEQTETDCRAKGQLAKLSSAPSVCVSFLFSFIHLPFPTSHSLSVPRPL